MCLLPGIDDETAEHYEEVVLLLISGLPATRGFEAVHWRCKLLHRAVGLRCFQRKVQMVCPLLLLERLSKQKINRLYAPSLYIAGFQAVDNEELVTNAISASLKDQNILINRAVLDLLTSVAPLNRQLFSFKSDENVVKIVCSSFAVLLKREMSLSRRVFQWLSGTLVLSLCRCRRVSADCISRDIPAPFERTAAPLPARGQRAALSAAFVQGFGVHDGQNVDFQSVH